MVNYGDDEELFVKAICAVGQFVKENWRNDPSKCEEKVKALYALYDLLWERLSSETKLMAMIFVSPPKRFKKRLEFRLRSFSKFEETDQREFTTKELLEYFGWSTRTSLIDTPLYNHPCLVKKGKKWLVDITRAELGE